MSVPTNVQRAINEGYEFRLGYYIQRGWKIVSDNLGIFIVGTLLFFFLSFAIGLVSGAFSILFASLGGFVGIIANQIFSQAVSVAVKGPMTAGFAEATHQVEKGGTVELNNFFAGFNKFGPLFITVLLTTIITFVAMIPGFYLMMEAGFDITMFSGGFRTEPPSFEDVDFGGFFLGALVAIIPALFFAVSYTWAPYLTWFYDIQGWEALETSRKLVSKNFVNIILFMIVIGIIIFAGALMCCVGLLVMFPLAMNANYLAFADAVNMQEGGNNADDIIDHFAPNA